eukprot:3651883-Prymnesium_polylepis.2
MHDGASTARSSINDNKESSCKKELMRGSLSSRIALTVDVYSSSSSKPSASDSRVTRSPSFEPGCPAT